MSFERDFIVGAHFNHVIIVNKIYTGGVSAEENDLQRFFLQTDLRRECVLGAYVRIGVWGLPLEGKIAMLQEVKTFIDFLDCMTLLFEVEALFL
jgi:hypothetical protein